MIAERRQNVKWQPKWIQSHLVWKRQKNCLEGRHIRKEELLKLQVQWQHAILMCWSQNSSKWTMLVIHRLVATVRPLNIWCTNTTVKFLHSAIIIFYNSNQITAIHWWLDQRSSIQMKVVIWRLLKPIHRLNLIDFPRNVSVLSIIIEPQHLAQLILTIA